MRDGELKRGRFSKIEEEFIRKNVTRIGVEAVADKLNRDSYTIKSWARDNLALEIKESGEILPVEEYAIRRDFRASLEWSQLNDEFLPDELKFFEHRYSKLVNQFKGDVLPTEETQIFHLIKFELLMSRNLKQRQRAILDVNRLEKEISDTYAKNLGRELSDKQRDRLMNLENQLIAARDAHDSKTNEYVKLSEKHSMVMKELKGTRDQRISKIENARESFLGLIKALQDEKFREAEGRDMELMNIATDIETKRLAQDHKYADDMIDKPLLSAETLEMDDA